MLNKSMTPTVKKKTSFTTTLLMTMAVSVFIAMPIRAQRPARVPMNRLVQQDNNKEASSMFQSGRDLITEQQWSKAEEQFRKYSVTYPAEKNLDAALYWTAYAQFQLSKYDQCKSTLARLMSSYQTSSWKEDARTLYAQLPGAYAVMGGGQGQGDGQGEGTGVGQGVGAGVRGATPVAATAPVAPVEPAADRKKVPYTVVGPQAAWAYKMDDDGEKVADDDPCEFKIVVLQALFQSDVQRGISAATDWLGQGSTQTVRCKSAALTLLARNGGKAVTRVILGVAQREVDLKLRTRAISALGMTGDESVIDPLRDFALNSQENSVSEAALYSLSQHSSARAITVLGEIAMSTSKPTSLRKLAIASIASRPGEPSVDALFKVYDADPSVDIRKQTIAGFAHRKSERAGTKLLEIARSSDNIELRKAAISGIATRSGEKSLDTLLSLYDSEKNEELKDRIINAVAGINDTRVTKKLIEIARNPQSPIERRRRAIGWLSRSKDPEVTKFLEELLK
jgi:HEAT repeat protein